MHDVPFFDRMAPLYDLAMPAPDSAALRAALARAERPVERIVEVGGGTGRVADALEDDVVVMDASAGMLARARRRDLQCVRADAGRLPVRTASLDAVLVVDALHHFPDAERALGEAARTLRPGGVLVVGEFDPTTLRGRGLVLAERVVGFDSTFWSVTELQAMVERTGLEATVVETGFGYTVAGVRPTSEPATH